MIINIVITLLIIKRFVIHQNGQIPRLNKMRPKFYTDLTYAKTFSSLWQVNCSKESFLSDYHMIDCGRSYGTFLPRGDLKMTFPEINFSLIFKKSDLKMKVA